MERGWVSSFRNAFATHITQPKRKAETPSQRKKQKKTKKTKKKTKKKQTPPEFLHRQEKKKGEIVKAPIPLKNDRCGYSCGHHSVPERRETEKKKQKQKTKSNKSYFECRRRPSAS